MVNVKILGTGCKKCNYLEERVRKIVAEHQIDAVIEKVSNLQDIASYGILATPGLVVNNQVVWSGSIPKEEDILKWLKG